MVEVRCKNCGGLNHFEAFSGEVECEYCSGLIELNDERAKFINLYRKADDAWNNQDFDEALKLYEEIVGADATQAEAHWSAALCRYGVSYVTDPYRGEKIPTCNRINRTSILADKNYIAAMKYASARTREQYEIRAKEIDRISQEFLKIVDKEEPYEVFISYKNKGEDGKRTLDSQIAKKLYLFLKEKGIKVFFAEETLKTVAGNMFEPYIFAALTSAKVMVLFSSCNENVQATWVKNEWKRYLTLAAEDPSKTLIPAYIGDFYSAMPMELSSIQGYDAMSPVFNEEIAEFVKIKLASTKKTDTGKEVNLAERYASQDKVEKMVKKLDCEPELAVSVLVQVQGSVERAIDFISKDSEYKRSCWKCSECKTVNTHGTCRECGVTKEQSAKLTRQREAIKRREQANSAEHKRGGSFSPKLRNGIIITLLLALLAGGVFYGVTSYIENKKVTNVEILVAKVPANITEYSYFEKEIIAAYDAYMALEPSLQKKVENADLLLNCLPGFNTYRVELIRRTLPEANAETIETTDVLSRLHGLYTSITNEQKAQLKTEEYAALEQYAFTYVTVKGIQELLSDVVGKYDTVSEIKVNYTKLKDEYKALVYNYGELEKVDALYNLQNSLVFTEANGGWAVSVKGDSKTKLTGDIVIPEAYQGQPVTTIPEKAFAGCSAVTSFTVPKSVTTIGKGAFSGCIKLQSITLPFVGISRTGTSSEGVFGYIFGEDSYTGGTAVKQYYSSSWSSTFYIPGQLQSVTITDATQLSYGAFFNCSMLTELNLNDEIIAANATAFRNCSGIKQLNVPGLTMITESLFSGCSSLETLMLNENVTMIEANAFRNCMNLKSLNSNVDGEFIIHNNVQSIGKGAFSGCIKLQSITLPFVGISRTGTSSEGVFGYIFGEDSYTGGTAVKQYYSSSWSSTFYIPNQLKSVIITDAMQLNYGAFYNCSMMTSLKINSGAKNSVGENAFYNCKSPKWS